MTAAVLNHLWQSTVVAGAMALLTLLFRRHRARVRYALWFIGSMKFGVPFALLISAGSVLAAPTVVAPRSVSQDATPQLVSMSTAVDQFAQPFETAAASAVPPASRFDWQPWAVALWVAGMGVVAVIRGREWLRVRAVVRASTIIALEGAATPAGVSVRSTSSPIGPGVFGWWRSVLLLPAGFEQWPRPQRDAVIAHELCHVQRRDTLAAAAHMVVEAVFWFHPIVWWIGSRLVDERERACDEAVLALGIDPVDYSTAILNVCHRYLEAPATHVPGATGADLRRRIEAILIGRVGARLSSAQTLALAVVSLGMLFVPVTAGVMAAPFRAQQTRGAQAFEVASIKPCAPQSPAPRAAAGGGPGGGGQRGGPNSASFSRGRAYIPCAELSRLIHMAYVVSRGANHDPSDPIANWPPGIGLQFADGSKTLVRGGPAWVYSQKYTVEAKMPDGFADSAPAGSPEEMALVAPMLQALLETRFKLKLHLEREQASMFALVVSKSGLKVTPVPEGGCAGDQSNGPVALSDAVRLGVKPTCGTVSAGLHDGNWRYEHGGQTLGVVATMLSSELGVAVLDRTGVSDKFNMTWEFAPDESTPRAQRMVEQYGPQPPLPPTAPTIFKALQEQLGLSVNPIKEQRGYFLVDHAEPPVPDLPIALHNTGMFWQDASVR